jgi:hypothetical protein
MENNMTPTKTITDVRAAQEIVWLGVDFTHAKLIGPSGFTDIYSIIHTQFASMNDLFVREQQKFNFPKFLSKTARYNLQKVFERNTKISPDGLILVYDTPNRIDGTVVQQIIDECQFPQENAIGLMFIVESLDKIKSTSFAWVTFIDLNTGKGIITSKFAGQAGGFGFRNYWANSFFDILKRISSILG